MRKETLKGLCLLNTRPLGRGEALDSQLIRAGAKVIHFPALEISAAEPSWIDNLPPLDTVDIALFVSVNAVEYSLKALKKQNIAWPTNIHVIAIGGETAKALQSYGISAVEQPLESNSEALLQLNSLKNIKDKSILLFKGHHGRTLIQSQLLAAGARLKSIVVYQQCLPAFHSGELKRLWQDDTVDIILLTSGQAIENLFLMVGEPGRSWLINKTALVISERLAAIAREKGMKSIIVSPAERIFETLQDEYQVMSEKEKDKKTAIKKEKSTENPQATVKKKQPRGRFLSIFSLFLAALSLVTAVYVLALNYQAEKALTSQKTIFDKRLAQLKAQQAMLKSSLEGAEEKLLEEKNKLNQGLEQLDKQLQQSLQQKHYDNEDWLLLKARYYLEMAEINSHWSKENQASIAMLKQADSILANVHKRQAFDIRQSIAKEIHQLASVPSVDIAGLLSKLDAASQMVNQLTLAKPSESQSKEETTPKEKEKENQSLWRKKLNASVNVLEKLVIIRKHDANSHHLLSPAYAALIRESIQLNLQQSQWAILNGNPAVYQLTLKQAMETVSRYFDQENPKTKVLLQSLKSLADTTIIQEKPDIQNSLSKLNEMIKTLKAPAPQAAGEI